MHISRRNRQLYWHIHIYWFLAKCTFTLQGKVSVKDVIWKRYMNRANKFITCLQNIFIWTAHKVLLYKTNLIQLIILNSTYAQKKAPLYNATECILMHRRDFLSISQQRTICTSTYKQYEDFDLMYLIKWGIDKYFEIVLV